MPFHYSNRAWEFTMPSFIPLKSNGDHSKITIFRYCNMHALVGQYPFLHIHSRRAGEHCTLCMNMWEINCIYLPMLVFVHARFAALLLLTQVELNVERAFVNYKQKHTNNIIIGAGWGLLCHLMHRLHSISYKCGSIFFHFDIQIINIRRASYYIDFFPVAVPKLFDFFLMLKWHPAKLFWTIA